MIQKASEENTSIIFSLMQAAAADMRSKGIMQWNENYPSIEHIQTDIEQGSLYIHLIENEIAGVISIDDKQSPEYQDIPWKHTTGKIMVIHRLAVSPIFQKQGIGRKLMDFALEHAQNNDYSSIRLDAYSKNERTIRFYTNRGYTYCGDLYFAYRSEPFHCLEKRLK